MLREANDEKIRVAKNVIIMKQSKTHKPLACAFC